MSKKEKEPFNPFYPMLIIVGVIFCVTACGYGVMTVRKLRNPLEEQPPAFIQWMDENGFRAMMIELGVLGFASVAAMSTDSYWIKRNAKRNAPKNEDLEAEAQQRDER